MVELHFGMGDRGASISSVSQFLSREVVFSAASGLEISSTRVDPYNPEKKLDEEEDKATEALRGRAVLVLEVQLKRNPNTTTIDELREKSKKRKGSASAGLDFFVRWIIVPSLLPCFACSPRGCCRTRAPQSTHWRMSMKFEFDPSTMS